MLNGCTFSGNTAAGACGGAIFNSPGGAMTISSGTIDNNSADRGGGIYNDGTLTVNTSTLTGNSSQTTAADSSTNRVRHGRVQWLRHERQHHRHLRAAPSINSQGSAATISGGTIDNNSAYQGGGIYNLGTLTVNSSTLAGNSSADGGGGVFIGSSDNTIGGTTSLARAT